MTAQDFKDEYTWLRHSLLRLRIILRYAKDSRAESGLRRQFLLELRDLDYVDPPPAAAPPTSGPTAPFNFDRYGVRVPAVIVSPYIEQGTVLRASHNVPYDHTSIAATLRKRFPAIGPPLTAREARAPDLDAVLTLSAPDNPGPPTLEALPYAPTPADVARMQLAPLNAMQKALVHLAANLPCTSAGADFASAVVQHIADLCRTGSRPTPAGQDAHVSAAADFIKKKLGGFFRGL